MPPRRSSRAPSVPVNPAPEKSLPAKRKRGITVESKVEENEREVEKPPSRARRSVTTRGTAGPPLKGRRTTRAKMSLPDVAELDGDGGGEEEEGAPKRPAKKARPSVESEAEVKEEEEEEDAVKPKRGRRTAKSASSSRKKGDMTEEMDMDENVSSKSSEPPSRRASTRKSSAIASGSGSRAISATSKAGGAFASTIVEEPEVEEEEREAEPGKGKGRRVPAKTSKRIASKSIAIQSDEEEANQEAAVASEASDYEEEPKPATIGRNRKIAGASRDKGQVSAKKAVKIATPPPGDDDSDDLGPVPPKKNPSPMKKAAATAPPPQEEEEGEERSLFDPPPPMPAPSSLPTTMPEELDTTKPRLVIHKLALVNFKSYAGRQEIGPFHKSFSAIVGPNGSGKSNTIDALLFVFGYRASKMRQGKISELIHNSANYPDLDDCSVEVHFREIIDLPGPGAFKVVPNSQLTVTRTAYKNNSSKYTINGRMSNYKEVTTLLKGRGIDLDHNRFLILQGEVESIAQMKPKAPTEHEDGLLEYLEDIIGTSTYKAPIDEAMVEVERLQEERQIKLNRLRHVEKEKVALEAAKKEAEDYLRLKNDHVRAVSRMYQWYLWKALESEANFKAKGERLRKDLEVLTEQNKDDIDHLEELKQHYEEREKTYEEVSAAFKVAKKDLENSEKRLINLEEKRKHASTKVKKLKKSVQDDTASRKTALNLVEDNTVKIKKEKGKLDEYEASLEEEQMVLEKIQDSLRDKTQVFHDKIQVKQKELQPWTSKINELQAAIDVATSEKDALAKKGDALKAQCREAEEALKLLNDEHKAKVDQQEKLKTEKDQVKGAVKATEDKLKKVQQQVQELKAKTGSARNKVEEAKSNQSENRSRNNVLDSLTRLRDAGNVDGFHGRLGSLGTIPDKYDVAISSSCGSSLNNMVVEKVDQAQRCIDYLRRNNVGRASFMVLEKLGRGSPDTSPTPEGVPRLFDLVKPKDPMFAPAFYKAIGNTIVASDIDQANRISSYKGRRWRVVTLSGEIIETSGTMTGGGSQPSRGAMSSKLAAAAISPQVMASYERESEQAGQKLQEAMEELRGIEQELERLRRRDPEIDMAYQKIFMDIDTVKRRTVEAEKRVRDLNAQNKPNTGDLARISKLEKDISSTEKELEKIKQQSGKIEQEIKDLEKKIVEIGGSKLLSQKSKIDGIRLHIKLANDELTKAEVTKAKSEKDAMKLESNIANNTEALKVAEEELEQLETEIGDLTNYTDQLREKMEAAQGAAENAQEDLNSIKKKLSKQENIIAGFRQQEMKLKQEIGDNDKEVKENDRAIRHYNELHEQLTLEDVDEEDEEAEATTNPEQRQEEEQSEGAELEVKMEDFESGEKKKSVKETPSNELYMYQVEELRKMSRAELVAECAYLEEQIKKARPDLSVLKEYKQREQEFFNRAKDLENITAERDAQKAKYDGLRKQHLDEFMTGFNLISLKLKEMYQMITLGGNAELELVDSLDPFSEGIIFSVMPPKKSWKNISNLSGGEKTLSSLALVFALHVYKPTPLYFMDEIDAALDFRNVSIVANYIKDRTKNAQFIIISLRNDMFELSHRLIGIYKTSNATRSISIDNHALHTTIPHPPLLPAITSTAAEN